MRSTNTSLWMTVKSLRKLQHLQLYSLETLSSGDFMILANGLWSTWMFSVVPNHYILSSNIHLFNFLYSCRTRAEWFNSKLCSVAWRVNMFQYDFPATYHTSPLALNGCIYSLLVFALHAGILKSAYIFAQGFAPFLSSSAVHLFGFISEARAISFKSCHFRLKSQNHRVILV